MPPFRYLYLEARGVRAIREPRWVVNFRRYRMGYRTPRMVDALHSFGDRSSVLAGRSKGRSAVFFGLDSMVGPARHLGILAGPIYIATSLIQALTREGFDLTRHPWSLLANGDLGWIHVSNLIVAGLLTTGFAVGPRRAGHSKLTRRLMCAYGLSLVGAGVFRANPALGVSAGGTRRSGRNLARHRPLHHRRHRLPLPRCGMLRGGREHGVARDEHEPQHVVF